MKQNLFYVILSEILFEYPEFKLLDRITPIHATTLENKEYYRLELPLIDVSAEGIELDEAHMSIYKTVDPITQSWERLILQPNSRILKVKSIACICF